jgi:hypothetical protein
MGAGSSFPFGLLGHAKVFANGAVSGAETGCQTTEHKRIVLAKIAERGGFEIVREHEGLDMRFRRDFLGPSGYPEYRSIVQIKSASTGERAGPLTFGMDELVA